MVSISIVTPIYKGNKYISKLIQMAEKNWDSFNSKLVCSIELILVNDYPEESIKIDKRIKRNIKIRVIQLKKNKGIHNARVLGLQKAQGEYILFLDQDDMITDDYLKQQWKCMKDADAVVCNGLHKRRMIYPNVKMQEKTLVLENFLKEKNQIVSSGQVLIKKKSIPNKWCNNIMKHNGADDYLLWILMLSEKAKFVYNTEKIYIHVVHGNNASSDLRKMNNSRKEMLSIVRRSGKLTWSEYFQFRHLILSRNR